MSVSVVNQEALVAQNDTEAQELSLSIMDSAINLITSLHWLMTSTISGPRVLQRHTVVVGANSGAQVESGGQTTDILITK